MFLLDTHYLCMFSTTTFKYLVDSLPVDGHHNETMIAFIDGDSINIYDVLRMVYQLRKSAQPLYVITLLTNKQHRSLVIEHLSDAVISKKIAVDEFQKVIKEVLEAAPKRLDDSLYGDLLGEIFKTTQKEHQVLKLLLQGYSQSEIADMLNISIKTVSSYKVKSVKRHGVRTFNELVMSRTKA